MTLVNEVVILRLLSYWILAVRLVYFLQMKLIKPPSQRLVRAMRRMVSSYWLGAALVWSIGSVVGIIILLVIAGPLQPLFTILSGVALVGTLVLYHSWRELEDLE